MGYGGLLDICQGIPVIVESSGRARVAFGSPKMVKTCLQLS